MKPRIYRKPVNTNYFESGFQPVSMIAYTLLQP